MKLLLFSLVLVTLLSSDELQRVQNIVDDITKLRADYESCQKQLSSAPKSGISFEAKAMQKDEELQKLESNLRDEKQRSKILLAEIDVLTKEKYDNTDLISKMDKLEKIIKNQEISLKTKEKVIKNLKTDKVKTKLIAKSSLNNAPKTLIQTQVVCEEKNSFPKLVMKESFETQSNYIEETRAFTPSAFRLKNSASIYDDIDGKEIYVWEKSTSFTSNEKSDRWVRVTGYFIDKKWLPSKEALWIKREDVIQR